MKVTYIEHSGFLLDAGDVYFLWDYYKGTLPEFDKKKPLVVFVSHKHQDHFNPWIFSLADVHPDTLFVLAKGVPCELPQTVKVCGFHQKFTRLSY